MPRNVRNFWVEASIDGRKAKFASGPRSKTGGIQLTVRQRNKGQVTVALRVGTYVGPDGQLRLIVSKGNEMLPMFVVNTTR